MMGTSNAWSAVGDEFWANVDGDIQAEFKVLTEEGTTGTVELIAYNDAAQTVNISPTVSRVVGEVTYTYTITSIGNNAFNKTTAMQKLEYCTLPSTVTSIGEQAFYKCGMLRSINIPAGVTTIQKQTFYECKCLRTVTFDEGSQLTTIGEEAFMWCNNGNFTSITLPNTVTTIGKQAFRICSNLKTINFPASLTTVEYGAFYGCGFESLTLPLNVTTWGTAVFGGCNSLTSVTFPDGMSMIPGNLVSGTKLTSVTIPASVTTIGSWAFFNCSSLSSVTFAENSNLTSIGAYAFNACTALETISIPGGVTTLGDEIFAGCTSLSSITLPSTLTAIPERFAYCSDGVTSPLTQVNIPSGVTSIGRQAFYHCTNLQPVSLPDGLVTIGEEAFYDCLQFEEITIPSTVESIGGGAFLRKYYYTNGNCEYKYKLLDEITCLATTPPTLGWKDSGMYQAGPFIGSETLVLPEDDDVVQAYATSSWGNYFFIPKVFTVDGVTYKTITRYSVQIGDGKTAAINTSTTEFAIPETIEYYNGSYNEYYSVARIASKAFVGCTQLTKLTSCKVAPELEENAFDSSMADNCTLYLPDSPSGYDGWENYFKEVIVEQIPKIVINGVDYSSGLTTEPVTIPLGENNGTATLALECEDKTYMPVLTLEDANISYDDGPAIEVNTYDRFYIRVIGENHITVDNAAAAISIGTLSCQNRSCTSLIILNDEEGGTEIPIAPTAPRRGPRKASNSGEEEPSLTIVNNTPIMGGADELMAPRHKAKVNGYGFGADGVYVCCGSFNVENCTVNIEAPTYGLRFYFEEYSNSTNAPRHNAKGGPKKVTPVNGPVDAEEYYGWLNIYEGSQLTLNGDKAALWGATGREYDYVYYPGYLQNVGLIDSDKSTYESDPNYTAIEGPLFFPAGQNGYSGSYYVGCAKAEKSYDIFPCKYLKFAKDCFTAFSPEGVELTFKYTGGNTAQLGTGTGNCIVSTPDDWDGNITIPATVTDENNIYNVKCIADKALYQDNRITSVTISEGIQYIGSGTAGWGAFECDYYLKTVYMPSTTVRLAEWCFNSCENLENVYICAEVVPELGSNIFYSNNNAILHVPAGTKALYDASVWAQYFSNDENYSGERIVEMEDNSVIFTEEVNGLEMTFKVTGENTVQTYGSMGSNGFPVPAIDPETVGLVTVPETVEYEGVVYTVTAIGDVSFAVCGNLTGVNIPNTVTSIGQWAFCQSGITSITLPEGVTEIGPIAFGVCPNLTSVYANMTSPMQELPLLYDYNVFDRLEEGQMRVLYVPAGCVEAYQTSDWWTQGGFSSIVEMGDAPATVPVTISSAGMATFSSEYALDFTNSDVKAYIVSVFSPEDHQLTLTRLDKVPAQTGLLLKGAQGSYNIPTTNYTAGTANMLKPILEDVVLQPTEGDYTNFVLTRYNGNVGFYRFAQPQSYSAGKAYLQIQTALVELANQNGVKGFVLNFDDEDDPTAISVIEEESTDDEIYNIAGQRMNKAQKGINIMNGKKVLVK